MIRKDRIGRRGGGVLLYINDTIPAYEVQLQEEADCNEAIWCNLVTGHTTVIIGVVYRCPNITKQNNEKFTMLINEVSKGDCIIKGDFNHGNVKRTYSAYSSDLLLLPITIRIHLIRRELQLGQRFGRKRFLMITIYHIDGSRHLRPYVDVIVLRRRFAFPDASNGYYFECVIYDDKSKLMFFYLIYFTVRCTYTMIDAEIK